MGNTTVDGTGTEFACGARDRLLGVTVGSSTTTCVLNALGQRVRKSGGAAGTVLVPDDEAGRLIRDNCPVGVAITDVVYLGDTPIAAAARLPTQPASRIDELLPHRWTPTS